MSNPAQKLAAAEARWEAAQLQAATAQRELDYAVAVFEKNKNEVDADTVAATYAQITTQQEAIKSFLMKSKQVWDDENKAFAFRTSRPSVTQ
jgi:hypothetical protein